MADETEEQRAAAAAAMMERTAAYGDAELAKVNALGVVIEARRLIDLYWAEDEMWKRPRRTFRLDQLQEVYDKAFQVVLARTRSRRAPEKDPAPFGQVAAEIRAKADAIRAEMMQYACGGGIRPEPENGIGGIDACTPAVLEACPARAWPRCPRQIMRYELLLANRGDKPPAPKPPPPPKPKTVLEQLVDIGVPEDIGKQLLADSFNPDLEAVAEVRAWLATDEVERSPYLLLSGFVGNGKSTAAAWALRERAFAGIWITCWGLALAAQLKDEKKIKTWIEAPLLVIDELGTEELSEGVKSLLIRLVYERAMKDTLITANVDRAVLTDRYTERFTNRVIDGGRGKKVPGGSMRKKKGA